MKEIYVVKKAKKEEKIRLRDVTTVTALRF